MMHFNRSDNMGVEGGQASESDAKEFRKKLRNRQSAQRARDRQKARMRWLEREVAIMTMKNQALQNENSALRNLYGEGACDARLQSLGLKTQGDFGNADAQPTETDSLQPPSPQRQRKPGIVPGMIQGKLRIINTERDKCPGNIDRVAVISPITRNACESPTRKTPTPQNKQEIIRSTRHGMNHRSLTEAMDVDTGAQTTKLREIPVKRNHDEKTPSKSLPTFHSNKMFSLPLASQCLGTGYENIHPYVYPCAYPPSWALVNLLPNPLVAEGINHHLLGDGSENKNQMQQTMKLLQEARVISSLMKKKQPSALNEEEFLNASYIQRFRHATAGVPITASTDQLRKTNTEEVKPAPGKNASWKRHKMNSFESECSSQISSESDVPLQSP